MNFVLRLLGYRTLEVGREDVTRLLNFCLAEGVSLADPEISGNGGFRFRLGLVSASRLLRACRAEKIPVRSAGGGLPFLLWRLRDRAGLAVGAICAVFLFVLSQKVVWTVRVSGNERLTAGEIRQELSKEGLSVGSYIPKLRAGEIETRILMRSEDLAWLAIHMDGTVAVVQVVERAPVPERNGRPANLVAARDGQVEGLELFRGRAAVHIGQPVRAGDLLVSGVYDSATRGYRYTRASGRVMARTERVIRVEIPFTYEEKIYEAEKRGGTVLQFFNFSLNFSKNSRNEPPLCDIIEVTTGKDWLGMHDLPVSVLRRTYRPYILQSAERSPEEALEIAYEQLGNELSELSPDVQPIGKRVTTTITDTALILECHLTCVENIAVQNEFDVVEPS
ncbi:MAG: sporulation protein YqfD [Clostridia bacterium]|nr:sporulation protein YqfD [Clostridia bacterium]